MGFTSSFNPLDGNAYCNQRTNGVRSHIGRHHPESPGAGGGVRRAQEDSSMTKKELAAHVIERTVERMRNDGAGAAALEAAVAKGEELHSTEKFIEALMESWLGAYDRIEEEEVAAVAREHGEKLGNSVRALLTGSKAKRHA